MITWAYFPQSDKPPGIVLAVVGVFEDYATEIDSCIHQVQVSDEVLSKLSEGLEQAGFAVERGKKKEQKILVPVLFGRNGSIAKSFEADAYHEEQSFVLEVEAGRGVTNYQFLKDLFQACMMHDVVYLGIAVRNEYRSSKDFEKVFSFFDTLYKSNRLTLPLKGLLILGY
ncbi:hypothetical protein ACFLS0_00640 [Candidatus Bipolaricaulota bacterium]